MGGLVIIVVVGFVALLAPYLAPFDPTETSLYSRLQPPNREHLLGTDGFGRDLLSRIIWGSRISLEVGIISVAIGVTFGLLLGVLAGYFGGFVDNVIMRFVDLLLCLPSILLAIAIVAVLGPGLRKVMAAVGITAIPRFARLSRASTLSIKQTDFVLAAKGIGCGNLHIMVKHVLPNILTPITVMATMGMADAIIMEAALSFLGIGVQPPNPTWGLILSEGRQYLRSAPWISTFAGLAIMFTVLGYNLLGDGLRDVLDPKFGKVRF